MAKKITVRRLRVKLPPFPTSKKQFSKMTPEEIERLALAELAWERRVFRSSK